MNHPFFSIIIPTYNRADTIGRSIDSILGQTYIDWELIIIDDGSTDDTYKVVGAYDDIRIRYVRQENQERSAARNHGIRVSQGNWICFLDSDDVYLYEHLEVLYHAICSNSTYKIFRTAYMLLYDDKIIYCNHTPHGKYDNSPYDSFVSFAISKEIIHEYLFDERFYIGEDFHFLLKIGQKHPFFIIKKHTVCVHYNVFNSGAIGSKYESNIQNGKACYEDMLLWYNGAVLPYLRRKRCLFDILLLIGHMKYSPYKIPKALAENIKIFIRFPIEYFRLLLRITFVKWGEWTGWYKVKYRF